jgi:hypothetical protein
VTNATKQLKTENGIGENQGYLVGGISALNLLLKLKISAHLIKKKATWKNLSISILTIMLIFKLIILARGFTTQKF